MKHKHKYYFTPSTSLRAFTIVELLVVIVVIGILAAITIVSYTGLSSKATLASLQSDLINSSKQLKIFQTVNGNYPTTISLDCSAAPDSITNKCLKLSSGNTITSLTNDYFVNNNTNPQTFSLTIKNSSTNIISLVTESSKPSILVPAPLNPVADWIAVPRDTNNTNYDHYGNYYDTVSKTYATVSRATTKTIYDPNTQHIYDVPANKLAINPRSDGKSGYEGVVEEGRTNGLLNSDFELDSNSDGIPDYWNGTVVYGGGTGTSGIYNSASTHGSRSYFVDKSNSAGQVFTVQNFTTTPGNTYTYSCWVNSTTTSALIDMSHDSLWAQTYVPSDKLNQWIKLTNTFTNTTTTASSVRVGIYGGPGTAYFDSCQLEVGTFATSYIPTTTTTANRNADVVTVPTTNWSATNGTLIAVAEPDTGGRYISWIGGTNYISLYRASGNQVQGVLGGTPSYTAAKVGTFASTAAMTWANGGLLYGYMDGVQGTATSGVATSSYNATANIGGYVGYDYINGAMQRLIVYSSPLSSGNITTVTNAVKDGP